MSKDPQLQTISVNLPRALVRRVQALGFNHDLRVSSIAEESLEGFLENSSEEENAMRLRGLGATLRRVAG